MTDLYKMPLWRVGLCVSILGGTIAFMSLQLYKETTHYFLKSVCQGTFIGGVFVFIGGIIMILIVLIVGFFRTQSQRLAASSCGRIEMTEDQHSVQNSVAETQPMAQWCRIVIWADIAVLALVGLASIPGTFRMLGSLGGFLLVAAVLLWSKVVLGLLADSELLRQRGQGLKLAYVAASIAVLGGLFTLGFVNSGAGAHPDSWVYSHRSGFQAFMFVGCLAWNVLYLVAARKIAG